MTSLNDVQCYAVGSKFPDRDHHFPSNGPSLGWAGYASTPLLTLGDPQGRVDASTLSSTPMRLGFAQYGPLVVAMLKAPEFGLGLLEAFTAYVHGADAPEVTFDDGRDHILWMLMSVNASRTITGMQAFTTSPAVTTFLRRAFAEQRATGPISMEETDFWMGQWYENVSTDAAAWNRVVVSSKAGA